MGCTSSRPIPSSSTSMNDSIPKGANALTELGDQDSILKLHITEGKDLLPADRNGFSDPFCIITFGTNTFKTAVVKKTLSPTWNQRLALIVKPEAAKYGVNFSVHDFDRGASADYLGRTTLESIAKFADGKVHDEWLDLELVKDGATKKAGQIRVSVQILTKAQVELTFWRHILGDFDAEKSGDLSKEQLGLLFEGYTVPFSSSFFVSFEK